MNETLDRINTVKAMVVNKLKADAEHNKGIEYIAPYFEISKLVGNYVDLMKSREVLKHFHRTLIFNLKDKPTDYIDNIADALNSLFKKAEIEAKEKMI